MIGAYLALDGENENYHRWDGVYCENEDLDQVYELLRTLGYKISDEELALKNGTHELFL